jgi:hypothetical protein
MERRSAYSYCLIALVFLMLPVGADLIGGSSSVNINKLRPKGADTYVLTMNGTTTQWLPAASAGSGDVVGPASATDNAIARFDTTTGKLLQNTASTIDNSGILSTAGALLSGLTASEMLITDASKNLASAAVATYPSLTELTYVKNVTSAIQTQINAKGIGDALTTNPLSQFAATTSAQLLGVLSDETGTGAAVFGTAPTFTTSMTGSYLTASEMVITDGSKNIVSAPVATYPSLTELAYVKGVTSSIQTQIDAAAASLWTDNGKNIYPADITDNVSIGHTFNSATLNLDGGISFKAQAEPTLDMSAGDYPRLYVDSTTNNLTFLKWDGMTQTDYDLVPGASVSGPGSSTDTAIALWDGTGGGTLKDSVLLVDAMGGITGADSIALGGSMANPLVVSTSALVVTTAGNVGIGETVPESTAHVSGNMTFESGGTHIIVQDTSSNEFGYILGDNTNGLKVNGGGSPQTLRLQAAGSDRIILTTSAVDITNDVKLQESIYFDAENDDGTCTTTDTIDWSIGNHHKSTLGGTCTYTFTAPAGPTTITLKIVQDGTGSRTAVFPAAVKWSGGTAPTLSTAAASVDIVSFYYDGSVFYGASALDFQ